MKTLRLNVQEADVVRKILHDDLRDIVGLIRNLGYDPATFFEGGDWREVDFRRYDLDGVSFAGAKLDGAKFSSKLRKDVTKEETDLFGFEQLILEFPAATSYDEDDFFVSDSNKFAAKAVNTSDQLIIHGPTGSGKSHLARIWQRKHSAILINSTETTENLARTWNSKMALVIEDIDLAIGDGQNAIQSSSNRQLVKIIKQAVSSGSKLLLTTLTSPISWREREPELHSAIEGIEVSEIGPPDHEVLPALLVKLLRDKGVQCTPDAINYLNKKLQRSYKAAATAVHIIDLVARSQGRPITRLMVHSVIDEYAEKFPSVFVSE